MPRKDQKNDKQQKATPTRKTRVNTKAAQHRHERNISKAREARLHGGRGGRLAQERIDQKAATRRRQAARTPSQRAEAAAAGREHRKPRFR